MVDLDKVRGGSKDKKEESGSDSGNTNKTKSSKPESVDKNTEPYSIEETSQPGEMGMADTSKRWAEEHGDLNFSVNGGESLKEYVARQISETSDLYDNIKDIASNHMEGQEEFTLYFHTLMLNLSNNRLGIMGKLQGEFNKSESEALKLTDKICQEAGEDEMVRGVLNLMVKELWEYEAPE